MNKTFEIHVNVKISDRYNEDTMVEFLADACSAMGLNEIIDIWQIHWHSNAANSRLAQNILNMAVGAWTIQTL